MKAISDVANAQVGSYVENLVVLTTMLLGFEPAINMLLTCTVNTISRSCRFRVKDYPLGVKVTEEWYNRGIFVVGIPALLMR